MQEIVILSELSLELHNSRVGNNTGDVEKLVLLINLHFDVGL